ncbi:unnamed protein product [Adineta steineri]|uniref:Ketosynthase family 3 (KS3) domain-containing protein n=1 Tax=Adineta steineri TaxID=433720 RepID=A0A819SQN6_9BILA|nr:unnamed protein product [Adineta steineri]CAF4065092.1 unnamed protein product [Adineta steineri]
MRPEHRSRFHGPNSLLYHFNLHGPNVSLDVTCSLSIEASHMAVQCLRTNEAVMAICGVDHLVLMLMVMLKISDAEHDVLSGHDGNEDKTNFVVPSAAGQGRLLENIYSRNNFDTRKILFVEAHGTDTPVGDPIEANSLGRFFNRSNLDPPLLLCSIKSNLGHTEGAAGIASLIKAAMCMYHRDITANMQFTSLNPKIDAQKYNLHILQNFVSFPILLNNEKNSYSRNSSISWPPINDIDDDQAFRQRISQQLLLKSTISYQHLAIFVFLSHQQLQQQTNAFLTEQPSPGPQLYESEPLFNKWINLIDGEMTKINKGEWKFLEELIEKKNEQESRINDTNIAQPILFAMQVALTALLIS